jgi:thiosulfate/3-mercaptopyruvate sulfurtransferase
VSVNLVSTQWLADNLGSGDVVVVDCSWHMPATKRDARAEFLAKHIPGARFYDLDNGSAPDTSLPHMLPSPEKFAHDMKDLGVGDSKSVVVYDSVGLFSAARLWWMLKTFGHKRAAVLDGGLPKWEREGRPLESGEPEPQMLLHVTPHLDVSKVKSLQDVASAIATGSAQIADARSGPRFRGEEAEPRPGVRAGHMPGARNVHYASILNADGTMKSVTSLRSVMKSANIDLQKPIITSCGSGVTAAIVSLALTELGVANHALYDGSWTEWGASVEKIELG